MNLISLQGVCHKEPKEAGQDMRFYLKTVYLSADGTREFYDIHPCYVGANLLETLETMQVNDHIDFKGSIHYHKYVHHDKFFHLPKIKAHSLINRSHETRELERQIKQNAREFYLKIFGAPKEESKKELSYPDGLKVCIDRSSTGYGKWFSFTKVDAGGGPFQAVQYKFGLTFPEAVKKARELFEETGGSSSQSPREDFSLTEKAQEQSNVERMATACFIWENTQPIQGTLAEKYLSQYRGVFANLEAMRFRYSRPYKGFPPALILAAENAQGTITAVHKIQLDPTTGNKIQSPNFNAKISIGTLKGSVGVVQIGREKIYLAEGPETGASIAMADPKATVLVSFGVNFIVHLVDVLKKFIQVTGAKEVVLAADYDGKDAPSDAIIQKAKSVFSENFAPMGVTVSVIYPESKLNQQKIDYNDILKHIGVTALRAQLGIGAII